MINFARVASKISTEQGDVASLDTTSLFDIDPIPLESFLYEKAYLGLPHLSEIQTDLVRRMTSIYPQSVLDLLGWSAYPDIDVIVALLGKGSGKDFITRASVARCVYLLLCLHDPHSVYGSDRASSIDVINMSFTSYQAKNIFFTPLVRMLEASAFFKDRFQEHASQLEFPKNIFAHSGNSSQESFEGFNPIMVVLDEIDAFRTKEDLQRAATWNPEHSAQGIYDALRSSVKSRFPGTGKMALLSFLRRAEGFMMQQVTIAKNDPHMFAIKAATWEVNPLRKREDFLEEFRRNPEDASMRYACEPTATAEHFFRDRKTLYKVFSYDPILDCEKENQQVNPWVDGSFLPTYRIQPSDGRPRFVHVDIGIRRDSASISCVHLDHMEDTMDGPVPVIRLDFLSVIDPLVTGEIDLESLREILISFRGLRSVFPVNILVVTFDGYQSVDSQQILAKRGIPTGYLSIDKDDAPYTLLKEIVYTNRLITFPSRTLVHQLRSLERVKANKVDHPMGGSKDAADSLAGAVFSCYEYLYGDISKLITHRPISGWTEMAKSQLEGMVIDQ